MKKISTIAALAAAAFVLVACGDTDRMVQSDPGPGPTTEELPASGAGPRAPTK